ncbi:acyl-CoA synthetase [Amnibacterium kyonggiense]|uniref:Fatty-acyl-CoA synthase n=1 Tax=Amnibacterium kyonggiense TaxID=595671 RepID=A0A4R7FIR4_9MICO|nr:long-chain fatty acid--CoA ligase [Amnibacterium kyonggiense]TDS74474.1 fatty-acyl-CoA synthase [Amnibacterium kyonggiense]
MIPEGIGGWLRRRAATSPDHPAIVFQREAIPYRALADRVDRLAAALQGLGVGPGDRVAYLGANHPSFVETLFAAARLGAVLVPLNTRLAPAELAYMLDDADPVVLVNGAGLESTAVAAVAGRELVRVVVGTPESAADPAALDWDRVLAGGDPAALVPATTTLDDPALIIYTSGTTGRPKGAVLTHGAITWNAINVLADYDLTSTDRALMISPLFHVASLGMGCLPVLLKGATVLLEERFVPGDALRSIEALRATAISGVPTTYQLMTEDPAWPTTDISSLRLLTCGGSAVPDRVREAYEARGLAFSGGYGMTETSPGVTMLPAPQSLAHGGSAGLAHFFTRYRIRAVDGALAPAGVPGEIEAAGPNVFAGYWRNPAATAAAFTDDGWLRTGDVGVADQDGFLTIADRVKDMIISGGENVYSAEVEQAIMTIEGVTGVAVLGMPHERWGEVPHAVVTLAPGRTLDPEELVARLSVLLARYKVPRTLEVVDDLPRTASGKVRKEELRRRAAARA